MDDRTTYGPEFHRLPFSRAVDQDLLADYKVVVLAVSEEHVSRALQAHLSAASGMINLDDAAKIVGCWEALQDPENERSNAGRPRPLRRAIAFTNTIKSSELLQAHWDGIVERAVALLPEDERPGAFGCETRHVDGQHHALDRKSRIEWLKGESAGSCRILSNARCLSEGIDVPALDAVLFMSPRNSQVDIVQAVGRAMRKAEGKSYGYIILPVAVPTGVEPAAALDQEERFAVVWSVLRALRSHDDRLEAEINQIDLNSKPTGRIIFGGGGGGGGNGNGQPRLPFPPLDLPAGAIYARIVDKCGDRKYWETWAKDVAAIFSRLVTRIDGLLEDPEHKLLREWFETFHQELRASINDSITRAAAIDMMAQHVLTRPVFEALFEQYDFAGRNPVARALDGLRKDFGEFGLENETRDLEGFYESVRRRARGLDNSAARQRVLMELYEKFFATALKKDADRLGIVYTPVEIVDFILNSADRALRDEFGRSFSDEGVHVLDPFTGTGIFLVRLLQSALIRDKDLARKYSEELHANEIVLLAYYIAAIHIEEAFHGKRGADSAYEPFGGIVLTDTFNLHTDRTGFPRDWLPDNSERAERQQGLPIQVVIGNPPWSAGQKSSADDNPNVDYPEVEKRVADTYAARSTATNKNSLYDTYKMAIRWASDRIGEQGVVALVTNGSWIDGNVDSGVRACLAEEFSTIYVLNLRGNQRTQGERSRQEGGKVFGQGSRAPVAITILVRNPDAAHNGCRILYRDIGDYLDRDEKLKIVREAESIAGIPDWHAITPDRHHDWIGQRDKAYENFYPIGSDVAKSGKQGGTIFQLFSNGFYTGKDAYLYNLSRHDCATNACKMIDEYNHALQTIRQHPEWNIDQVIQQNSNNIKWDATLVNRLKSRRRSSFEPLSVRRVAYRPFVASHCYVDDVLAKRPKIRQSMFPESDIVNRAICVPGVGSNKPFSVLAVDSMPDIQLMFNGQYFPRFRFERRDDRQASLPAATPDLERVDNITDAALEAFRARYGNSAITKDRIFDYVYGILHSPKYRERFANDLLKELPRLPFAPDFHAFEAAGGALLELHIGYEKCEEYPLDLEAKTSTSLEAGHFRIGTRAMRFADKDKTILVVNEHVRLTGIPPEAHQYQVNGRTPLEWFIDRYRVKQDSQSGIVNDPNGWFEDPQDLITAIRRIVHISVRTTRIMGALPKPFDNEDGVTVGDAG